MSSHEKRNLLLRTLPAHVAAAVYAAGEVVHLELREHVIEPNKVQKFVDFPETGVMSLLTPMDDGSLVEIATVGNEGMIGVSQIYGVFTVAEICFCQVVGSSLRIESARFRALVNEHPELLALCQRYTMTLFNQVARNLGCNRTHSVEERCARWLLQTHDRCNRGPFTLTQEFLAIMLGVSRTGVNLAAGVLARAGLITYVRGRIDILDRAGLELVCCDCYASMNQYYNDIMEPLPAAA